MNIYDEAGLTESWARYWLAMDGWTIDEAAFLLCGVSPSEHNLTQWGQRQSFDMQAQLEYEACFKLRRNLLQSSAKQRVLTFPARPGAVIEWAMGKGMRLPVLLIPVDMEVRSGRWVKQGTPPELVAMALQPAPVAPTATDTATPAPVVTVSDKPAPLRTVTHSTKTRRDALTPVIELAQSQCRNQTDTAEVWAALLVLAERKNPPLIGATEDGLQYLKNGNAASFNRDALRKRLDR